MALSNPFAQIDHIERMLGVLVQHLASIDRKVNHVIGHLHIELEELAMDRAQLDRLLKATRDNTDATQAAANALSAYVTSNAELTAKLKAALENVDDDSEEMTAVLEAANAIEANNETLKSHIPQVATAITDNTGVAGGSSKPTTGSV